MKLRSRTIYAENGIIDGCIEIVDGKVSEIFEGEDLTARDLGADIIIPGIFDTHIHGTQGYMMWPDSVDEYSDVIKGFLKGSASEGVTSVFPTLYSMSSISEKTLEAVAKIADLSLSKELYGARIIGLHYEGPYISRVGEKGTATEPLKIDLGFVDEVIRASKKTLRLMGLSPELPEADKLIEFLCVNGVEPAYAHSDCKAKEAQESFDRGVRVVTHLCNAMVGVHHRDVGGVGAALNDDRVYCELICDGLHVDNQMIRLILNAKPNDKIILISDCTGYSGALPGEYSGDYLGRQGIVIVDDQGFVREPGGRLRGSSMPSIAGIRNIVENELISLEDALKLAALNPAVKYGIANKKGSLKKGKDADFVIIDSDYNVKETYVEGVKVFDRASEGGNIFNQSLLSCRKA